MLASDVVTIVTVIARVLFLVLFCGAFIWFITAFSSSVKLLPPPQRIELTRSVTKRFMIISWAFLIVLSIGGIGALYTISAETMNQLFSTQQGLIIVAEGVVTMLFFLDNLLMQFVFLPRLNRAQVGSVESSDKALKYFTLKNGESGLKAISALFVLGIIAVILGVVAIALGVLFSSPNIDTVPVAISSAASIVIF